MRKVPRYVIFSALKVYWKHEEEEEGWQPFVTMVAGDNPRQTSRQQGDITSKS